MNNQNRFHHHNQYHHHHHHPITIFRTSTSAVPIAGKSPLKRTADYGEEFILDDDDDNDDGNDDEKHNNDTKDSNKFDAFEKS
jgi:hypothetical protein